MSQLSTARKVYQFRVSAWPGPDAELIGFADLQGVGIWILSREGSHREFWQHGTIGLTSNLASIEPPFTERLMGQLCSDKPSHLGTVNGL